MTSEQQNGSTNGKPAFNLVTLPSYDTFASFKFA